MESVPPFQDPEIPIEYGENGDNPRWVIGGVPNFASANAPEFRPDFTWGDSISESLGSL